MKMTLYFWSFSPKLITQSNHEGKIIKIPVEVYLTNHLTSTTQSDQGN